MNHTYAVKEGLCEKIRHTSALLKKLCPEVRTQNARLIKDRSNITAVIASVVQRGNWIPENNENSVLDYMWDVSHVGGGYDGADAY